MLTLRNLVVGKTFQVIHHITPIPWSKMLYHFVKQGELLLLDRNGFHLEGVKGLKRGILVLFSTVVAKDMNGELKNPC